MERERRGWAGHPPAAAQGWSEALEWDDAGDGTRWRFFIREPEADAKPSPWRTVKIVARGRVLDKANFWVGVNIRTGRVADSKAVKVMREYRPDMLRQVERWAADLAAQAADLSDIL